MINLTSSEDSQRSKNEPLVKLEFEDSLDDQFGPFNKRLKHSSPFHQSTAENTMFSIAPSQYNPLDEPSPLGLRLRKSPSLLELIQMRLSHGKSKSEEKIATKSSSGSTADKLKASNFPALFLKIGSWEYTSRYEGDLVAKCYFAKHKLVWEILQGGLKSKIEIQWSDIMGLKADFPDDAPATLVVAMMRQPLFFRETNPQPRKHTLWQAATDFTDGQASLHKKHFLQVPHGLLNKHFEKLIQCDMRLNFLSRQPEIILDSPYFESHSSAFEDPNKTQKHVLDKKEINKGHCVSLFEDVGTPSMSQTSTITFRQEDALHGTPEIMSREALSPSSVIEGSSRDEVAETKDGSKTFEQRIMRGLRPSMSMTDLVNHIGNCISEQPGSDNPTFPKEGSESHKALEDIAQHLLSDIQSTPCADEKSLMSRVNSLCCLLQKDGTPIEGEVLEEGNYVNFDSHDPELIDQNSNKDGIVSSFKPGMQRIDSYGDLLLHLPRIASLPKLLFDISEDGENQAR